MMDEFFGILAEAIDLQTPLAIRLERAFLPKSYVHQLSRSWDGRMMVTLGTRNGEYHAHVELGTITEIEAIA